MKTLLAICASLFTEFAFAQCNFPTGSYIDKIDDPSHISFIDIEVPQSSKYAKNLFKIHTSSSRNIPPKLRKKFKANITVQYSFGVCTYKASIRQSGDFKDHIALIKGQPVSSLDIKLKEGNIANSVGFKLLIPHSRKGLNEVLGSLLLKNLGFIAPETFEVATSVNGIKSVMLFQEKSSKELLERNFRREGPIFEGDESLLWSYKSYDNFDLEALALSRLVNENWFEKGLNSQAIVFHSSYILQKAYLKYAYEYDKRGFNVDHRFEFTTFPNLVADDISINYHGALIAMDARHALRPHNRKYYYNAIESRFEPIYYDGMISLDVPLDIERLEPIISFADLFPRRPTTEFINLALSLNKHGNLESDFLKRVQNIDSAKNFFQVSLKQFKANMRIYEIEKKYFSTLANPGGDYVTKNNDWYLKLQNNKAISQRIVTNIAHIQDFFTVNFENGETLIGSEEDVSKIISKNDFKQERVVYMPSADPSVKEKDYYIENFGLGFIKTSTGMGVEIAENKKTIIFTQSKSSDWALMSGVDLTSWNVVFIGEKHFLDTKEITQQRFNDHGLTGCLSIYKSLLNYSSFLATSGGCEDSINFVNSIGYGITLEVENAYADAVDADFSNLSFKSLNIRNAGNDCFDVSGGLYEIASARLSRCQDKAISIGEKSTLSASNIVINRSNIALAAKDLSKVSVKNMRTVDVKFCAEIKRKKQEFGGAKLQIRDYKCSAPFDVDLESVFLEGKL